MKNLIIAMTLSVPVLASGASAQDVNLTGPWQCVALCLGPPAIRLHRAVSLGPQCPGRSAIKNLDRLSRSYLVLDRQSGCKLLA